MPTSNLLNSKRALVKLLRELTAIHGLNLPLTRDSPDADVTNAFKRVAAKVHPDKGGSLQHSQQLHAARDAWQEAVKGKANRCRPATEKAESPARPAAPMPSAHAALGPSRPDVHCGVPKVRRS